MCAGREASRASGRFLRVGPTGEGSAAGGRARRSSGERGQAAECASADPLALERERER